LQSFLKALKEEAKQLADEAKINIADLIKAFQQREVFKLLKGFGFSLKLLWKALSMAGSVIHRGLVAIFVDIDKNGQLESLKRGAIKVDELLHKYPLLKTLSGLALAGLLTWMWLQISFVGDFKYDFDVGMIIDALHGSFKIDDLFLSPQGLTMLTLFATGVVTGVGFSWITTGTVNLIVAFVYTASKRAKNSGVASRLRRLIPNRAFANLQGVHHV
jgi:hypothetical protein